MTDPLRNVSTLELTKMGKEFPFTDERHLYEIVMAFLAMRRGQHASDCAVHNEPALPAGECDCKAQPKWVTEYERLLMSDNGPAGKCDEWPPRDDENKRLRAALEPFAHYYIINDCETADNDTIEVPVFDLWKAHVALTSALGKP